ncbi:MAG: hypothetical protein K6E59_05890 [Bacilli bacterium]|nr:hypothetical protein [Bacilli bacterium]
MDIAGIAKLESDILAKRKELPFLSPYAKKQGLKNELGLRLRQGKDAISCNALIAMIEEYQNLCEAALAEQSEELTPDAREAVPFLLRYLEDRASDPNADPSPTLKTYACYVVQGIDAQLFLPAEQAVLLTDLLLEYQKAGFPWRAKEYACMLRELLSHTDSVSVIYTRLCGFYREVCDLRSAMDVCHMGANALKRTGNLKEAATLESSALGNALDVLGVILPSEEEIKAEYGEYAEIVLGYPKRYLLRHDPRESAPEFQDAYDEVMEEVLERLGTEPAHGLVLWHAMTDAFSRRGISWRDPHLTNPGIRFD